MDISQFTTPPGTPLDLGSRDPDDTGPFEKKKEARKVTKTSLKRLDELQERFYADGRHALLVVLQAMDAAGKDGTIRHVMGAADPQGVQVTPFKVPSAEELDHDFLWRVHKAAPRKGLIGIFNRSHYEDVLVVRVKGLKPETVWSGYYDHINDFERLLADSGTTIIKLFLHISPEEQAERLLERRDRPDKQWKFSPGDLEDRKLWHDYQAAYEDALSRCNTAWAPWYVVPANRKWYRNLVVSEILGQTLDGLGLEYPRPVADIESFAIPDVGEG
jgi:PPK2 family polyphosphate:nucleotide phosphotransferase